MFEHESDFWYWPENGAYPTGPGSDADQIKAYASCGLTYLSYNNLPGDAPMTLHCAFTIMALEANV